MLEPIRLIWREKWRLPTISKPSLQEFLTTISLLCPAQKQQAKCVLQGETESVASLEAIALRDIEVGLDNDIFVYAIQFDPVVCAGPDQCSGHSVRPS